MNPQSPNEQAGFNLPSPHAEVVAAPQGAERNVGPAEVSHNPTESASGVSQPLAAAILPLPPSFATNATGHGTNDDVSSTTTTAVSTTTNDQDLIEKEWVNKAKAIVEKTQNDPYQQSRELNYLRANYLQTQYNKNLKLSK
jgi:hypothetical protein